MVSSFLKKMSCCNDSCKEKNKGQRQNIYVPYSFVYKQYQHTFCYKTDNLYRKKYGIFNRYMNIYMQYFYVTLPFEVIKISCRALTRKTSNTFTKVSINVIYTCSVMQTRIRKAFVHIYFALFS